jgi:hypothetical protein
MIKLTGILSREINLKTDKNRNYYYHGWLRAKDGTQPAFFFFRPDYNLSLRVAELKVNQAITLQGFWSKISPNAFLASDFWLEEVKPEQFFSLLENQSEF